MGVAKHLLPFDSLREAQTEVAKCVIAFNSLCGAQTGVANCVIAFDSLPIQKKLDCNNLATTMAQPYMHVTTIL